MKLEDDAMLQLLYLETNPLRRRSRGKHLKDAFDVEEKSKTPTKIESLRYFDVGMEKAPQHCRIKLLGTSQHSITLLPKQFISCRQKKKESFAMPKNPSMHRVESPGTTNFQGSPLITVVTEPTTGLLKAEKKMESPLSTIATVNATTQCVRSPREVSTTKDIFLDVKWPQFIDISKPVAALPSYQVEEYKKYLHVGDYEPEVKSNAGCSHVEIIRMSQTTKESNSEVKLESKPDVDLPVEFYDLDQIALPSLQPDSSYVQDVDTQLGYMRQRLHEIEQLANTIDAELGTSDGILCSIEDGKKEVFDISLGRKKRLLSSLNDDAADLNEQLEESRTLLGAIEERTQSRNRNKITSPTTIPSIINPSIMDPSFEKMSLPPNASVSTNLALGGVILQSAIEDAEAARELLDLLEKL